MKNILIIFMCVTCPKCVFYRPDLRENFSWGRVVVVYGEQTLGGL